MTRPSEPADGDVAAEVRSIIATTDLDQLDSALREWSQGRNSADVAFAFGQVLAELEPLEDAYVSLTDPDNEFGSPAFDGLASTAWRHLAPGDYQVDTSIDGQRAILRVADRASTVISPPVTAEAVAQGARFPNPASTITNGETTMTTPETTLLDGRGRPVLPTPPWGNVAEQATILSTQISDLEAEDGNPARIQRATVQLAALLDGQRGSEADALRDLHDLQNPAEPDQPAEAAENEPPADRTEPATTPPADTPSQQRSPAPVAPPGMRVTINGNLAAEPTYGVADSGRSWARLRVASNERVRDTDGQWTDAPPVYTEVVIFGSRAETAVNSMQIGDPVIVKGRPEVETFARRDGSMGAALKVFASSVTPRPTPGTATAAPVQRTVERATPSAAATLHHTPTQTIAVGVGRDDKALQGVLKDNGFKWSAKHTAWYLPASMGAADRDTRVAQVNRGVYDAGLTLNVSDAPAASDARPVGSAPETGRGGFARDGAEPADRGVSIDR
ncbi:single-stranded DNA-binding protein [Nakamurella lactea]|uniref:single-stranded DNA-binding protein n=1 Tax=Nakamurella lactea TaxID=459515 RepID=UPI0003FD54C7|nr:single-stranded DNA-binding protein [Nakamurella lactea]